MDKQKHYTARDLAKLEAMKQSERYYQAYGYEFENYGFTDAEWHWIQVEENWYYEADFYHDWLTEKELTA